MRHLTFALIAVLCCSLNAAASVIKLRIERREIVLNGQPFGAAGPYEKLVGKVDFALDPTLVGGLIQNGSQSGSKLPHSKVGSCFHDG